VLSIAVARQAQLQQLTKEKRRRTIGRVSAVDCSYGAAIVGYLSLLVTLKYAIADVTVKPGFHPNAIACVSKQPIMVATASTEHHIGCCLQPIGCSVEAVATMIGCLLTQLIAFGWKPGLSLSIFLSR